MRRYRIYRTIFIWWIAVRCLLTLSPVLAGEAPRHGELMSGLLDHLLNDYGFIDYRGLLYDERKQRLSISVETPHGESLVLDSADLSLPVPEKGLEPPFLDAAPTTLNQKRNTANKLSPEELNAKMETEQQLSVRFVKGASLVDIGQPEVESPHTTLSAEQRATLSAEQLLLFEGVLGKELQEMGVEPPAPESAPREVAVAHQESDEIRHDLSLGVRPGAFGPEGEGSSQLGLPFADPTHGCLDYRELIWPSPGTGLEGGVPTTILQSPPHLPLTLIP